MLSIAFALGMVAEDEDEAIREIKRLRNPAAHPLIVQQAD
jgi:hypothetical protein